MSAVPYKEKKSSSKRSFAYVSAVLAAIGVSLFVYLMWFVSPADVTERVKIIAVTEAGCIGETADGFAVNIGSCDAQPGDYVMAQVDQKVKDRAAAMNPTR